MENNKNYAITLDGKIFSRCKESELENSVKSLKNTVEKSRKIGSIGMLMKGNVSSYRIN